MDSCPYLAVAVPNPAKSLLFALGIVVEAAITRQLITCVAVVNSGIHIFRNILNSCLVYRFLPGVEPKIQRRGSMAASLVIEVDSNA
jgi:hypothetical protein